MSRVVVAAAALAGIWAAASSAFAQAPQPGSGTAASPPSGAYRDGSYTGKRYDAFWGKVQLRIVVANGLITTIQVLDYPHDRQTSQDINHDALPTLEQEVIQAQNVKVHAVTGATVTTIAYINSLRSALQQAQ